MQVAAAPPQLATANTQHQSPLSINSEANEWDNLSPIEKRDMQMAAYNQLGQEVAQRTKKGTEKKEKMESNERKELWERHRKEQAQKSENERKEIQQKEISAANVASQNGGFNNGIQAMKGENQRKRKADEDPFHPSKAMMPNNAQLQQQAQHQQWQMQQQQQMYQAQMMQQQNMQQRIPSQTLYPNFAVYPPCSTTASTSNGDHHRNSPVVPSVSQASSITTPPQGLGQGNQQGQTPPALVQHNSPVNDLVTSSEYDHVDKWATEIDPGVELRDLGDLGQELDLLDGPSTFSNNAQQQQQGPSSNVVSPQDGYQMPVNGPQSAQSLPNPMSNGPPMTPTSMQPPSQQPAAQMSQQFPGIGNPMFSSTPKNPLGMPDPSMPNPMASLQSPHAMASPHMAPALHSPHMGNLQSPGLPPQMMQNGGMPGSQALNGQQNPMSMTPNPMANPMSNPMAMTPNPMAGPWGQSQPWAPPGGMPSNPLNGFSPCPPEMMGMGFNPQMTPNQAQMMHHHQKMQQHQKQLHMMQQFLQMNPATPAESAYAEAEVSKQGLQIQQEILRRFGHSQQAHMEWARYCQTQKMTMLYMYVFRRKQHQMEQQKKQWYQQHQQMMTSGLQSPSFAPYPPPANYMPYPQAPIQ